MDALRKIHAALVPGGLLVDTQPLSARSPVEAAGRRLGSLDMREWAALIAAVDGSFATVLEEGLYSLEDEARYVVTDSFASGAALLEKVSDWRGTRISISLAARIAAVDSPAAVHQQVRMRLLRACDGG